MIRIASIASMLLLALGGCDRPPREEATSEPAPPAPKESVSPSPSSTPDEPIVPSREVPPTAEATNVPPGACRVEGEPIAVFSEPASADIAFFGERVLVGGWFGEGEGAKVVVRIVDGATVKTIFERALSIAPGTATPTLRVEGSRATLAYVGHGGRLFLTDLSLERANGAPQTVELARDVDRRFPIAIAPLARARLVAFTSAEASMRVKVLRVDDRGKILATDDVTPEGMGATAPDFVDGEDPPRLVFADARAGVSPLLTTAFDREGRPRPTTVVNSVGGLLEPPRLAAARVGGESFVAYTALGMAATSAVGLVRLASDATPTALVKGEGYGPLTVDATRFGSSALFASEAPGSGGKDAPREIRITLVRNGMPGDHLVLAEPGRHPRLATGPNRAVALVHRTSSDTKLFRLVCRE